MAVVLVLAVAATGCQADTDGAPQPEAGAGESSPLVEPPSASAGEPEADAIPEDLLLPNMRSLSPTDLQVVSEQGQVRLRFAGLLANVGDGPMLVNPTGAQNCPPAQRPAVQVIHRDTRGDGTFQREQDPIGLRRPAGCMLDHRGHDHWHFDAMARYTLRALDGERLVSRAKVSFCLRDNERAPAAVFRVRRAYFGECGRNAGQGISPGWVDIYTSDLDSQYLALPSARAPRTYCLEVTADPRDQLLETDETDNTTSIAVRVGPDSVRRVPVECA